ncbi:protein of unknown function [Agrobacterium pusense]|uniref:Uncharacterized protein n=1 Tax=Agrobacterium pusense TaxID=648995 RepID=U4Q3S5_9HYPH|nr:protein of unknown function [Agrobacterium pusense]
MISLSDEPPWPRWLVKYYSGLGLIYQMNVFFIHHSPGEYTAAPKSVQVIESNVQGNWPVACNSIVSRTAVYRRRFRVLVTRAGWRPQRNNALKPLSENLSAYRKPAIWVSCQLFAGNAVASSY